MVVTQKNADRLLLNDGDGRYLNPFAENMSAWLKKGFLDASGEARGGGSVQAGQRDNHL